MGIGTGLPETAFAWGRDLSELLESADPEVARCLKEIQMILHTAATNLDRGRDGVPTVNGVWLWGGGQIPAPGRFETPTTMLWSDDPVCLGQARWAGVGCSPALPNPQNHDRPGIIVRSDIRVAAASDDHAAWSSAMEWLDEMIDTGLTLLTSGGVQELQLLTDPGPAIRCRRRDLARFWRRRRRYEDQVRWRGA